MKITVLNEHAEHENRVALVPETIARLAKVGHSVRIEAGAGLHAHFPDAVYQDAGATIAPDAGAALEGTELTVMVQRPAPATIARLPEGSALMGLIQPAANEEMMRGLTDRKITVLALERIPRITRAQSMDVLSSQSNLAGYRAVILAAEALGKIFPMLMTAAGTVAPAKTLVIGAGVAGLQAIATARRLGAVVSAFDVRPAVKEQVESLGARFLEIDLGAQDAEDAGGYAKEMSEEAHRKEEELLHQSALEMDVVITTALIPGRPAPRLISADTVRQMRPGAVIVDLAGEAGGNCELTRAGEVVVEHDVTIIGPVNLPASVPFHASQLFSRNIASFLGEIAPEGSLTLDWENEIIAATCLSHQGEVRTPS